ncbi:hypothetical protein EG329_009451 [Mollisiaceae sp. DMI_Dod_QoI]|nr:hypothetical protein EG329_009451 [Helotiales sp. DMI_Dod_QoI]
MASDFPYFAPESPTSLAIAKLPPQHSKKRKYESSIAKFQNRVNNKRVKAIGRPKNGWTPSRSRKLVRLYLMSGLNVDEIATVLRTKKFKPCKRDIQNQLKVLLQSRPNKLRPHVTSNKVRLQILRESRRQEIPKAAEAIRKESSRGETQETEFDISRGSHELAIPDCTIKESWLEYGIDASPSGVSNSHGGSSSYGPETNSSLWSPAGTGVTLPYAYTYSSSPVGGDSSLTMCHSRSTSFVPSLESSSSFTDSMWFQNEMIELRPPTEMVDLPVTPSSANVPAEVSIKKYSPASLDAALQPFSNALLHRTTKEAKLAQSILSAGVKSYTASMISIGSLRRRFSRKTDSCLGDILSLLQNFTIGGSSDRSSKMTRWSVRHIDDRQSLAGTVSFDTVNLEPTDLPVETDKEHVVPLAGVFIYGALGHDEQPAITTAATRQHAQGLRDPSRRNRTWVKLISSVETEMIQAKAIDKVDSFGNSILHVAATLPNSVKFLLRLLDLNADMHLLNSANQTFLHLLHVESLEIGDCLEFATLLDRLQVGGFDFHQRDDHGQSPIHLLTRRWVLLKACIDVPAWLLHAKIKFPRSRDNLGRTIEAQMARTGSDTDYFQHLDINGTQGNGGISQMSVEPQDTDRECLPNYGNQTPIETLEDLRKYEHHADLLRTVVRACTRPHYEDPMGRNGLHCLAEALDLPSPGAALHLTSSRREAYLEDLLASGVDPDNHNKEGDTPLMSFIIHVRDGEDDDVTTRILSRLYAAGVNINRRNRKGETPLHIATKLGRRAATKFLLSKNANVHARDSSGKGIIALGRAHSKLARKDEMLYAQIMLCISLVADAGGASAPTVFQEWALK